VKITTRARRGFTIIEVMIVIAIAAMVMTAGIPMMWKMLAKEQLAKAVNDVIEGCKTARDRAILQNQPYEFVIRNKTEKESELTIEAAKIRDPSGLAFPGSTATVKEPGSITGDFPRKLGDDVMIQLIDVNFVDHMGFPEARVRFYPNGTSDEFTVVLKKGTVQRQIHLDTITGTAFEVLPK
jgi:prepilin-type N-terminal cleavage/methylation domain-containing protein